MPAAGLVEVEDLRDRFDRAEELRQEAADAEHAAYVRWQESFAAYEKAKNRASSAWSALTDRISGVGVSGDGTGGL